MRRAYPHITALLLSAVAVVGCSDRPKAERVSDEDAAALLENRNWMDRWPTSDREELHVYRFTPAMGGGVYQDRTLFAGHFELFTYEIRGNTLDISWPHSKESETLELVIERVEGPEPFDLRLRMSGNLRGPSTFYGRSSETEKAGASADFLLRP